MIYRTARQMARLPLFGRSSARQYSGQSEPKNPYSILGLDRTATKEDIKLAYANLVKQHHPDVSKATGSPQLFHQIKDAYSILSNETKRRDFDEAETSRTRTAQFRAQQGTHRPEVLSQLSGRGWPMGLRLPAQAPTQPRPC